VGLFGTAYGTTFTAPGSYTEPANSDGKSTGTTLATASEGSYYALSGVTTVGSISATAANAAINIGQHVFIMEAPQILDHYDLAVVSPQTAGVCSTGVNTVTAKDSGGSIIASDTSTVNTTYSGSDVTFYTTNGCSSSTTSYTLSSGVANIYYKTNTAQSFTITATKASSTETGTSSSITVNPGTQTRLVITLPGQTFTAGSGNSGTVSHQTAGTQFTIPSINATDDYFNVVNGYSGAKTLAYTGPSGSPTYTTLASFTNGASTTTLLTTLPSAEITTITVTDGGQYGYVSSSLTVDVQAVRIRGGTQINGGTTLY
jgi:hypothetical protein